MKAITVEEGPQRVLELLDWGANFDKDKSKAYGLAFTREGGHSFARILHAYGDATGKDRAAWEHAGPRSCSRH